MNTQCWVRPMLVNVTSPFTLFAEPFPANAVGMSRAAESTDIAASSKTFFTSVPFGI